MKNRSAPFESVFSHQPPNDPPLSTAAIVRLSGVLDVRTSTSTENAPAVQTLLPGIWTYWDEPSRVTAPSLSPGRRLVTCCVGEPTYVPFVNPCVSVAVVDESPSRQ